MKICINIPNSPVDGLLKILNKLFVFLRFWTINIGWDEFLSSYGFGNLSINKNAGIS